MRSIIAACGFLTCLISAQAQVAQIPATAARPSYNTGTGFYVVGRGIYDANGNLFTPMGANRQHYDMPAPTRFQANPNVERLVAFFNEPWATVNKPMMDEDVNNGVVPIPGVFYYNFAKGLETTGTTSLTVLNDAVNFWVNQAAHWTEYNNVAMFNIANEWGPCADDRNPSNYQNGYVAAIGKLRAAGYTAPLIVDAPCSGQGVDAIYAHAANIEAADPLHSIVFSIHSYGEFYKTTPICNGCGWQWSSTLQNLAALPVPVIFGEFGCGPPCGDTNPTPVLPDDIMQAAQTYGFGWMAWSWDDGGCEFNLLGPCPSTTGVWDYADRTAYGMDVINSPGFGMQAAAQKATTFPP